MFKLNKKIIGIIMIAIFLFAGSVAFAQSEELPEPGMLPDHPLYFAKRSVEGIGTFFSFGDEAKANRYLKLSEKRLAEVNALIEKDKPELAEKVMEKYQGQMNKALERAEEAKEKGRDMDEVLGKISETTSRHQKVLAEVYDRVPEEAKEGIQRAMEAGSERSEEAINAMSEENREEAREKVRENRERMNEKLDSLREEGKPVPELPERGISEEAENQTPETPAGGENTTPEEAGEVEEPQQDGQNGTPDTIGEEAPTEEETETDNIPENPRR